MRPLSQSHEKGPNLLALGGARRCGDLARHAPRRAAASSLRDRQTPDAGEHAQHQREGRTSRMDRSCERARRPHRGMPRGVAERREVAPRRRAAAPQAASGRSRWGRWGSWSRDADARLCHDRARRQANGRPGARSHESFRRSWLWVSRHRAGAVRLRRVDGVGARQSRRRGRPRRRHVAEPQ